jgi:LysM domain
MKISVRFPILASSLLAAALLPSCGGPSIKGLPKNLPTINLYGSKTTPPHSMAQNEYPFDADGDYKTEWVAGGSTKPEADYTSWRSSHGGEPTPQKDYTPPKKKKSSSSSKSKSKGGSYTIKAGDSLSVIAAKTGTSVAKLRAANGLKGDMIRAGKTLKIPK